jgi:hypothetical protein
VNVIINLSVVCKNESDTGRTSTKGNEHLLRAVAGYRMADHKLNKNVGEELEVTDNQCNNNNILTPRNRALSKLTVSLLVKKLACPLWYPKVRYRVH